MDAAGKTRQLQFKAGRLERRRSPVAAPPKRNDRSTPASLQSDSSEPNLRQYCGQISRPQNRPSLARNGQGRLELSLGSSEKLRIMPRRMSERSNDVTVYM